MRASEPSAARGLLLVLLAAVLWGTSGVVAAVLYRRTDLNHTDVGFARLAIGALALGPVALRRSRVAPLGPHRRLVLAVGVGLATFQVCYFAAVAYSGVSLATLITLGLAPVLVAAGSPLLLGAVPRRRTVACLGLALVGLALLVGFPVPAPGASGAVGTGLAVGSAVGYAAVTLGSRGARDRVPVLPYTAATFAVGAVVIAPATLSGGMHLPTDRWPLYRWASDSDPAT